MTAPAVEPVTLVEAKAHLRIDHGDEDSLITSLIVAARKWAENETRRAFITTTFRVAMDTFPSAEIILPRPRLISVTSITYVDSGGTTQTVSASNYIVDTDHEPGRIAPAYNAFWPSARLQANSVLVTYTAGFGAAATSVPDSIKAAIKLMVAQLYEHREPTITGTIITQVPFAMKALLDPWRVAEVW